jgi:hypothetical protein
MNDRSPLLTLISCTSADGRCGWKSQPAGDEGKDVIQYRCENAAVSNWCPRPRKMAGGRSAAACFNLPDTEKESSG